MPIPLAGPWGHPLLSRPIQSFNATKTSIKWLSALLGSIQRKGGIPDHGGPSPLSGSMQNGGGSPDQGAIPPIKFLFWVKWLSPLFGFILNEGGITDHGATPPYRVLSKMKVASRTMPPPIWFRPK